MPYLLVAVDEYWQFPFVFPCRNMKSSTVIVCLSSLFCIFGFPSCVHGDRGSPFVSQEMHPYLSSGGISFSTSTAYHPTGNSQCERFNQIIWRTIKLLLHGRGLPKDRWEEVLAVALRAVRSLVCLTNETPHKRLFRFPRRSINGMALLSWLLTPGTALLRRHVRNKGDPFCDPVELVEGNPTYSVVRSPDGRESRVSTSDLARCPPADNDSTDPPNTDSSLPESDGVGSNDMGDVPADEADDMRGDGQNDESSVPEDIVNDTDPALPRRSTRRREPPDRYGFNVASVSMG